jgi:site-specific recombinase XerD
VTDATTLFESFARELRARRRAQRTVDAYRDAVTTLVAYLRRNDLPVAVEDITRDQLRGFIADQADRHSPGTAISRHGGLRQFFKFALSEGLIETDPMEHVGRPQVDPNAVTRVLTNDQLDRLYATCANRKNFTDVRDAAILHTLVSTGMRRAELAGLRAPTTDPTTNDIDLDRPSLRVTGKGGEERLTMPDADAVRWLDRYLRLRAHHPHAALPWLWLGRTGRLTDSGIAQAIAERGIQAGLPFRVRPHMFRATMASQHLARGGSEATLRYLAGWRSNQMVTRYTRHAAAETAFAETRRLREER